MSELERKIALIPKSQEIYKSYNELLPDFLTHHILIKASVKKHGAIFLV